ncbi:MAG: DIM6/NTAB family protein [Rhodobacteraceae bacterium HLUCCA12]|nr:MAG: DIM6/NTAB family protein [Rhodobacteraceae bacterium HLUCCA12]
MSDDSVNVRPQAGPDKPAFLGAMRHFVGSVSVITVGQGDELSGLVVTSAISLSADPPLVLVCVNRNSSSWPLLERHGVFGVNALAAHHQPVAERFSGFGGAKGAARYDGAAWVTATTGAQLLADAPVALDCTVEEMIDRATHSIVIGRVQAIRAAQPQDGLIYWHGAYRGLRA